MIVIMIPNIININDQKELRFHLNVITNMPTKVKLINGMIHGKDQDNLIKSLLKIILKEKNQVITVHLTQIQSHVVDQLQDHHTQVKVQIVIAPVQNHIRLVLILDLLIVIKKIKQILINQMIAKKLIK